MLKLAAHRVNLFAQQVAVRVVDSKCAQVKAHLASRQRARNLLGEPRLGRTLELAQLPSQLLLKAACELIDVHAHYDNKWRGAAQRRQQRFTARFSEDKCAVFTDDALEVMLGGSQRGHASEREKA